MYNIRRTIEVSFIAISTESSSNTIKHIVFPNLVLTSHCNIDLLIHWLKAYIPRRVQKLKFKVQNAAYYLTSQRKTITPE